VADNTADVVISNCVINLSPNKQRVFDEAYRVLKPNGRLLISDMVLLKPIPEAVLKNVAAYIGCISGAEIKTQYLSHIKQAGFKDVKVVSQKTMPVEALVSEETANQILTELKMTREKAAEVFGAAVSMYVSATKPS
jgi:ubiquinone/menaquinone biosynthesis C-methylase UbiE